MQMLETNLSPAFHPRWIGKAISNYMTNSLHVDYRVLRIAGEVRYETAVNATGGTSDVPVRHSAEG